MAELSFTLKVDGQNADPRRLECQFQSDPYPGGHHYELIIADAETVTHARKIFGAGIHQNLDDNQCRVSVKKVLRVTLTKQQSS